MGEAILIIEDNPKNIKLFRDVLKANGYATLEATNGEQGVNLARAYHPSLILMDIQMPVMDGLQAANLLKAHPQTQEIPLIAVTARAMKGDEEKALQAGYDGYITKPIRIRYFLRQVAAWLSQEEATDV